MAYIKTSLTLNIYLYVFICSVTPTLQLFRRQRLGKLLPKDGIELIIMTLERVDGILKWTVQCCFTSIKTAETIRDGEPRMSTSTFHTTPELWSWPPELKYWTEENLNQTLIGLETACVAEGGNCFERQTGPALAAHLTQTTSQWKGQGTMLCHSHSFLTQGARRFDSAKLTLPIKGKLNPSASCNPGLKTRWRWSEVPLVLWMACLGGKGLASSLLQWPRSHWPMKRWQTWKDHLLCFFVCFFLC